MATFRVTFKESYMPHKVVRTAEALSREQVIDFYHLDDSDIEWYKIEKI